MRARRHAEVGDANLSIEKLETRQALSVNMAEIVGAVRLDVRHDGHAENDTLVADAAVRLYRDNGNGQLDASDTLVGQFTATDGFGRYQFTNVSEGRYFVKLELPAGLVADSTGDVREVIISAVEAEGKSGPVIDEFRSSQFVEATPRGVAEAGSTLHDPGVLGDERDLYIGLTGWTDSFSSVAVISGGGMLRVATGPAVAGTARIVWDGQDGNAATINPAGLNLDFSSPDGNGMTAIQLTLGADHPSSVLKLKLHTSMEQWSEFVATVPQSPGGAASKHVTFHLADTHATGPAGSVSLDNLGAVELTLVGVAALDVQVSRFGFIGPTTRRADFIVYRRDLTPTSISGYVYVDGNNDGMRDGGEKPISNVVITLSGADIEGRTVARATVTDNMGLYRFANLAPGTYRVSQPTQPRPYRDGLDAAGATFDAAGMPLPFLNGFPAPDVNDDDSRDADALDGIILDEGFAALDYNFSELATTISKVNFIRLLIFR